VTPKHPPGPPMTLANMPHPCSRHHLVELAKPRWDLHRAPHTPLA
jgi:hypothetical protein